MFTQYLILVSILSLAAIIYPLMAMRGVCYFSGGILTDNEKLISASLSIKFWQWPSLMHHVQKSRAHLREYYVLILFVLVKVLGVRPSDYCHVLLSMFAHAISAIMIYVIGSHYFSLEIAVFLSLIYLTSLWPFHVGVYIGHVIVSQMISLLAMVILLTAGGAESQFAPVLYALSGALIGISFASSSASRKYPPLFLALFLFEQSGNYKFSFWAAVDFESSIKAFEITMTLILATIYLNSNWITKISLSIIEAKRGGKWTAIEREQRGQIAINMIKYLSSRIGFTVFLLAFVGVNLELYINLAYVTLGVFCIFLLTVLPNIPQSLARYYMFLSSTSWASHFQSYKGYQSKIFGREFPDDYRGQGLLWVFKLMMTFVPFVFVLFLISSIAVATDIFKAINSDNIELLSGVAVFIGLLFISLLPLIVSETSNALQVGKAYFPLLPALLIMIGFGVSRFQSTEYFDYLMLFLFSMISVQSYLTFAVLARDLIPSRLGPTTLFKTLKKLGVKHFYTYDSPFNVSFVDTMIYSYPNEFSITRVTSIQEVPEGEIMVVPPMSSKSLSFESVRSIIEKGDFRDDSFLNALVDDRSIEKIAIDKIKTFGTSRYWSHESEVTSYRQFFTKDIGDSDLWLGHGWVLRCRNLLKDMPTQNY